MATTLQQAISQLRVWFPSAAPFWAQFDGNAPNNGETTLRAALALSKSVTLSNHLAQMQAAASSGQTNTQGAVSAFSASSPNSSSHWGAYFGAGFNFAALYLSADEVFDVISPDASTGKWHYANFQAAQNFTKYKGGGAVPNYFGVWPYCLFDEGSFNAVDGVLQAFRWVQNFWASNYPTSSVPIAAQNALDALNRDLAALETSAAAVSQTIDDASKTGGRLEAETLGGFTAAGVGTVLFGGAFTAATATLAGEIAVAAAENLAELAAGMFTRAISAGETAGESATIAAITGALTALDNDIKTALDNQLGASLADGVKHKVSELLGQTSVLINGQEVRLLDNLFVRQGAAVVPLSDALKGAVYQDSNGTERHALSTLASIILHQDIEAAT